MSDTYFQYQIGDLLIYSEFGIPMLIEKVVEVNPRIRTIGVKSLNSKWPDFNVEFTPSNNILNNYYRPITDLEKIKYL